MAKLQNPPQGGEKWLCLTLFCTMMLSVVSAVAIIYSIVIIYVPSKIVLESNITGPVMCTTLSMERGITGILECMNWSSCEEWCLSKSNKECSHVYAATRELGTEVYWEGCDFTELNFVDHKCNILEDLIELNCKLYSTEEDENGELNVGSKEICVEFDDMEISCMSGICKNVSAVYKCDFSNRLTDIENDWNGKGYCSCNNCYDSGDAYQGQCPEPISRCNRERGRYDNDTLKAFCSRVDCGSCKAVCSQRGQCFDMHARRDPTVIGTDEYANSVLEYYTCKKGYCTEIYNLTCERMCDSLEFNMREKNSVIFSGERIIIADCSARSTADQSRLNSNIPGRNTLMVACSNITVDHDAKSMITTDCVNGTWMDDDYNNGKTNYSHLMKDYSLKREDPVYRSDEIFYELDIIIINSTKLKFNIEGCSNTLEEECKAFYHNYGRDGRNYTARAIFPCWYDPGNYDFVVINFYPDKTLMLLIFFAAIPGGILLLSCTYMCGCSRFIHSTEDGHMRLRCCGKFVTGIGNVPIFDPPRKKKFTK